MIGNYLQDPTTAIIHIRPQDRQSDHQLSIVFAFIAGLFVALGFQTPTQCILLNYAIDVNYMYTNKEQGKSLSSHNPRTCGPTEAKNLNSVAISR